MRILILLFICSITTSFTHIISSESPFETSSSELCTTLNNNIIHKPIAIRPDKDSTESNEFRKDSDPMLSDLLKANNYYAIYHMILEQREKNSKIQYWKRIVQDISATCYFEIPEKYDSHNFNKTLALTPSTPNCLLCDNYDKHVLMAKYLNYLYENDYPITIGIKDSKDIFAHIKKSSALPTHYTKPTKDQDEDTASDFWKFKDDLHIVPSLKGDLYAVEQSIDIHPTLKLLQLTVIRSYTQKPIIGWTIEQNPSNNNLNCSLNRLMIPQRINMPLDEDLINNIPWSYLLDRNKIDSEIYTKIQEESALKYHLPSNLFDDIDDTGAIKSTPQKESRPPLTESHAASFSHSKAANNMDHKRENMSKPPLHRTPSIHPILFTGTENLRNRANIGKKRYKNRHYKINNNS